MSRRTHTTRQKRAIATRLQGIIEERFRTFYRFKVEMRKGGAAELASTVRGWLPPQKAWKAKPDGKALRRLDWEEIRLPNVAPLMQFCDFLKVRADFVLFGTGAPYRGQERDSATLAQKRRCVRRARGTGETASECTAIGRQAAARFGDGLVQADVLNGDEILSQAVELACGEARAWRDWEINVARATQVSHMLELTYKLLPATARHVVPNDDARITAFSREPHVSRYFDRGTVRQRVMDRLKEASDRELEILRYSGVSLEKRPSNSTAT